MARGVRGVIGSSVDTLDNIWNMGEIELDATVSPG